LLKYFAAQQQARAGDCAVVTGHLQLTVHARMFCRKTAKSGLRNSVDAQNKAGVLNSAARVDQAGADCASLRALYVFSHDREPVRTDRFHLVVEEKKPRAVGVLDGIIFCCGIVRSVCEIQHTMRRICGGLSNFVALVHLNDHDFVIRIACSANHTFQTSLERPRAAETRNDNRDFSGFAQLASHIECMSPPVHGNVGLLTSPFQVRFNCAPRSF